MKLDRTAWFRFVGAQAAFGSVGSTAYLADPAVPSIFSPSSTLADSIYHLSLFVLAITGAIFMVVFSLLAYAAIKFRRRADDDGREPPQIYGSNQVELAWTMIPVLIVVVPFFLAAARVIHAVEDAKFPPGTIEVTAIGHQFWWEFQYPDQVFITAKELHIPLSNRDHPTPTHIRLMSADTNHSFCVPQLAVKTDLIPGGLRGPARDSVATTMTRVQLVRQVIQGGRNMPAYGKNLNPAEVTPLVCFLETLHPAGRPPARDASQTAMQQTEPTPSSSR